IEQALRDRDELQSEPADCVVGNLCRRERNACWHCRLTRVRQMREVSGQKGLARYRVSRGKPKRTNTPAAFVSNGKESLFSASPGHRPIQRSAHLIQVK